MPSLAAPCLALPRRVELKKTLPGPALPGHASPRPAAPCRAKLDCLVVLMSFLVSAARQRARSLAAHLRREADTATSGHAARIGAVTAAERAAATRHAAVNLAVEFLIRHPVSGVDINEHRQITARCLLLLA